MNKKLHPLAIEQAKVFKKSKTQLVEILSQMDETKEYSEHGVNSLWAYCVNILGLSPSDTGQLTAVIRKAVEVPSLKEAVTSGTLSVEKASRITPVLTQDNQAIWIKKAQESTHRQIEKAVKEEKPEALLKESIKPKTKDKSELRVNISGRVEEKLRRARIIFRATSFEETLEKALDIALKHKDPIQKAERVKHRKCEAKLAEENLHRTCEVQTEPLEKKKPNSHYVPASLKHQVVLRDKQQCQEKGCNSSYFTEIHHIVPLSQRGKHELSNLITLCSFHHSKRHGFQRQTYKKPDVRTIALN